MNQIFIRHDQQIITFCLSFLALFASLASVLHVGTQTIPLPLPIFQLQPTPTTALAHDHVYSIDFSPDGRWVATGGIEGIARIWDTQTAKLLYSFVDRPSYTLDVKFSADGNYLFTSSADNAITNNDAWVQMWNIQKGVVSQRFGGSLIRVMGNNRLLLRATNQYPSRLVDISTGNTLKTFHNSFLGVNVSPDGKWFSLANFSLRGVQLWDLNTETLLYTFVPPSTPTGEFSASVEFSSDSRQVLIQPYNSESQDVFLLDLATSTVVHTFPRIENRAFFSATGHEMMQFNSDGSIEWISIDSGKIIRTFPARVNREGKYLSAFAFSPDATQFLTARYSNGSAYLWDSKTGIELHIYDSHLQ